MPKNNYYLFVDLETTGLDPEYDHILEYAMILTDGSFKKVETWGALVDLPSDYNHWNEWADDIVAKMHEKSGLTKDWEDAGRDKYSIYIADRDLDIVLDEFEKDYNWDNLILAGSGVSHFDMRFLRKHMPAVFKHLHWCPLDVGQIEEWLKVSGQTHLTYDAVTPGARERKTHRAMDDISYHLDEARYYKGLFFELARTRHFGNGDFA